MGGSAGIDLTRPRKIMLNAQPAMANASSTWSGRQRWSGTRNPPPPATG
jgi:hypothetical protein